MRNKAAAVRVILGGLPFECDTERNRKNIESTEFQKRVPRVF